jgi:hypothetical protein
MESCFCSNSTHALCGLHLYVPIFKIDIYVFKEMQTFMYHVFKDHLRHLKVNHWSVSLSPLVIRNAFIYSYRKKQYVQR